MDSGRLADTGQPVTKRERTSFACTVCSFLSWCCLAANVMPLSAENGRDVYNLTTPDSIPHNPMDRSNVKTRNDSKSHKIIKKWWNLCISELIFRAAAMAQQVNMPADLVQSSEPTWWEERPDFGAVAYPCTHTK